MMFPEGGYHVATMPSKPIGRHVSFHVSLIVRCAFGIFIAANSSNALGNKVTTRPPDQTLLIDGKPFFPVGLYYAEEEIADESGQLLKELRDIGFNTVFFHAGDGKNVKAKLDRIAAAG